MVRIIEEEILEEEIIEEHKSIEEKLLEGNINVTTIIVILIGLEVGSSTDNIQIILEGMIRSNTSSRSGYRAHTNRDRIRSFRCREYDHFAKDCPNVTVTDKVQTEQMQQMLDSEEPETTLKVLTGETYDSLPSADLEEMINHLNY